MNTIVSSLMLFFCLMFLSGISSADPTFARSIGVAYLVPPDPDLISRGALLECNLTAGEGVLLVVEGQYASLDGVCDDRGDTPCDGKMLSRIETCTTSSTDYSTAGVSARYSSENPFIICYDPTGNGECTPAEEVARGTSGSFTGSVPDSALQFAKNIQTVDRADNFRFEGARSRVSRGTVLSLSSVEQPEPGAPDNCLFLLVAPESGADGCGIVSISIPLH